MLMAQDGTNLSRTLKVTTALDELRDGLANARNLPPEFVDATDTLIGWIGRQPHGIRRASIASKARSLLSEPPSFALYGYVDGDVIDRASALDAKAISALRAQVSSARQFLPDLPFASYHLDGVCDALMSLSLFFTRVVQVRRHGKGLISEHQGGSVVARTRTSLSGKEYCEYCHRPTQIYAHVHEKVLSSGLTCVSGPSFTSVASEVHGLPIGLSPRFCGAHIGGSSNRWSKAGSRNRDCARTTLLAYRRVMDRAGLFRPHSERIQRYVAEIMSSRKLTQVESPRLRAGFRRTAPIARDLLLDVFAPLGLPQRWLHVDENLCELAASPDGSFLRTSVEGAERFELGSERLEGWRSAFERCISTFKSYFHRQSNEAWLTVNDLNPDPESPFLDLPIADLSIAHLRTDFGGNTPLPWRGPVHLHSPGEDRALASMQPLLPQDGLRNRAGTVLRVSFISPAWLSRVSLLGPEMSRREP